ncbi:hypothetical protein [Oceanobacillus kapialis]|uniref:hypothetical protein n=1 Tax=Oceanobacillus kapialis TaxID=481353 RepID=UPI00384CD64E
MYESQNNLIAIHDESIQFCVKSVRVELERLKNDTPMVKQHAILALKNIQKDRFVYGILIM